MQGIDRVRLDPFQAFALPAHRHLLVAKGQSAKVEGQAVREGAGVRGPPQSRGLRFDLT